LPCLSDKIQAIAINGYVQQRRKLDDELDEEKVKLQYKMRNLLNPSI
jgi:Spy/CpxP family protein refolding chaperone